MVTNKASGEQEVQAISTEMANNVVVHHDTTQSTITSKLALVISHILNTHRYMVLMVRQKCVVRY